MKVVVDTNVIVSGIINPYGKPAHVLNLILNGELILCIDSRIYREYERVLKSPKFSFPEEYVKVFLDFLTFSQHPKGVGFLFRRSLVPGAPLFASGGQTHYPYPSPDSGLL